MNSSRSGIYVHPNYGWECARCGEGTSARFIRSAAARKDYEEHKRFCPEWPNN